MAAKLVGNQVTIKLGRILPRLTAYREVVLADRAEPPDRSNLMRDLIDEALTRRVEQIPAGKRDAFRRRVEELEADLAPRARPKRKTA